VSADYHACFVYGVLLTRDDCDALGLPHDEDAFDRLLADDPDSSPDEPYDEAAGRVATRALRGPHWETVCAHYGLDPDRAWPHWTGDGDHRPGRCDTGPWQWVLGYGDEALLDPWPAGLRDKPGLDWHTWVEAR
jgi:hypothetical protein